MNLTPGKTYRELVRQLLRSAESDRSGRSRRDRTPDEWSRRSAFASEMMANFFERLIGERGNLRATPLDIENARAAARFVLTVDEEAFADEIAGREQAEYECER